MIRHELADLRTEFISELTKCDPEDLQKIKLILLAVAADDHTVWTYLKKTFDIAEHRKPLLIEMK